MANQDFRVKNGLQEGLGASVVGIVTAESFSGSAVGLTSVPSASLTGTISSERLSGTYNIEITGTVSGDSINVGAGNTGVFANSDGTLLVTGIATFKDRVIFDSTNSIQIPVGTTEERGFRLLQTKDGSIGIGSDRITGINTSGIEQDQYILGPSGVLRSGTQVNSVGIGSIGIGLTALAGVTDGEFKFGTIDVVTGQIRYNSELSSFEGYGPGNAWGSLGGIKDVDADTYITAESSAGADEDTLTFYTAGTSRVVIDSDGKTGIGTDNPTHELDIESDSPTIELRDSDHDYTFQLTQSGSATYVDFDHGGGGSSSLRIRNATDEKVRISSNGDVGIGTNNPLAKLEVKDGSVYVPGGTFNLSLIHI